jgi:threonine dehydratase
VDAKDSGIAPGLMLKLELLQRSGSFKVRGAFNALLDVDSFGAGVLAASGGNFGLGVAMAASDLGIPATIFVPGGSSAEKIAALQRVPGVGVEVHGDVYMDALAAAQQRERETGTPMLHAYDQFEVVAGQGTCGLEFRYETELDTVLVAVGGGGLLAGTVAAFDGTASVVAVETDGTPTLQRALEAGGPVPVDVSGIAADSLGAAQIGELGLAAARHGHVRSLLVSDTSVREAQRWLWERARTIAEPGGATALAAVLDGSYAPGQGERVGVIVCGANTGFTHLAE